MNTDYLFTDLFRGIVGVAALLLAAMVLRLLYVRLRNGSPLGVHPALYFSFALSLVVLAALRVTHVDMPPTWDLWPTAAAVALGWYAVMKRAQFTRTPPWRR